jgi:peptide/nickel transport system permease protein
VKTYVARRLLALIPVGLVVATVAFMLIHLAPGNPASIIAGDAATADDVRAIERQLGLDPPRLIQEAILDRAEPTLLLTAFSTLLTILIGVPAGVVSARYNSITAQL